LQITFLTKIANKKIRIKGKIMSASVLHQYREKKIETLAGGSQQHGPQISQGDYRLRHLSRLNTSTWKHGFAENPCNTQGEHYSMAPVDMTVKPQLFQSIKHAMPSIGLKRMSTILVLSLTEKKLGVSNNAF
jgi:hypothetical protein